MHQATLKFYVTVLSLNKCPNSFTIYFPCTVVKAMGPPLDQVNPSDSNVENVEALNPSSVKVKSKNCSCSIRSYEMFPASKCSGHLLHGSHMHLLIHASTRRREDKNRHPLHLSTICLWRSQAHRLER